MGLIKKNPSYSGGAFGFARGQVGATFEDMEDRYGMKATGQNLAGTGYGLLNPAAGAYGKYLKSLQGAADGTIPSAAELTFQRAHEANQANQASIASSVRGGNVASAYRNYANNVATMGQANARDTAILRAQEQAEARAQLGAGIGAGVEAGAGLVESGAIQTPYNLAQLDLERNRLVADVAGARAGSVTQQRQARRQAIAAPFQMGADIFAGYATRGKS